MSADQCAPRQTAQRTKAVRINKDAMATTDKAAATNAPFDPVSLLMIAEPEMKCGLHNRLPPPRAHVGASLASETPTPVGEPRRSAATIAGGIRTIVAASSPEACCGTTGKAL
jgi:hypothetical protein